MAEQRFGIFGKDVTRYIPPELRPFLKAGIEMNPVTGFQRAGQALKEGDYGDAALETGILAAAPVAYFGKTLIKPSVTAGIDALKEMFLLGAADEAVKKAPVKKGVSRRDVLAGMGATVLVPPVAKGIVDLIPATGAAKVAKVGLKGPIGSAAAKANRLRDLYFGTEKALKGNPLDQMEQALKQSEEMDAVTLSMNKELSDFLKGKNYDDFMKLKDEELIALGEIQQDITHVMRTGSTSQDIIYSGAPLREKSISEALSKAIEDRGLRDKVTDLSRARMFESLAAKREARKRAGFTGESAIDLPGDIIPKMFPSEKIIKKMLPSEQTTKSIFAPESKRGRQLLIVSCSKDKCPDVGNMKALDRYTGMLFTKMKKAGIPPNVDVAILSAKHGLIRSDTPIENYDQLMTDEVRDSFLKNPDALKTIRDTMAGDYSKVFVTGGKNYKEVIQAAAGDLDFEVISKKAPGLTQQAVVKKVKEAGDFFHYTDYTEDQIKNFDISFIEKKNRFGEFKDILGLHVGGRRSAEERGINMEKFNRGYPIYQKKVTEEDLPGSFYSIELDTSKPYTNPYHKSGIWTEEGLEDFIVKEIIDNNSEVIRLKTAKNKAPNSEKLSFNDKIDKAEKEALSTWRKGLASRGFTNVPYINAQEDAGSLSHIMLIDRPKGDKVITSKVTGEPMKDGGVAGLSDIARDMFKGPKGIGTYESFMVS